MFVVTKISNFHGKVKEILIHHIFFVFLSIFRPVFMTPDLIKLMILTRLHLWKCSSTVKIDVYIADKYTEQKFVFPVYLFAYIIYEVRISLKIKIDLIVMLIFLYFLVHQKSYVIHPHGQPIYFLNWHE